MNNEKPMRRRPWAAGFVIFLGLVLSGGGYAAATNTVQAEFGSPEQVEEGRKLFAGPCDFIWAAMEADKLPPATLPEIAFAGRSNVGKSSLVNALTGRKTLARTSHTPGRTQELIYLLAGLVRRKRLPSR